ncbi:MAG: O-antigen ligase family protein [Rhodoluna sp.]
MNALTQPIRVIFNTREKGYRPKTWVASIAIFTLMAGDAVRYSIGWYGWGVVLAFIGISSIVMFAKNQPLLTLRIVPWPFYALLAWMGISTFWSAYPFWTALATVSQILTTLFALFLVARFSWRHLLRVFSNVIRFILGSSLIFEFIAAAIVHGPIAPIFKNYTGDKPPAPAFYWTQGHLFDGSRIQGIVGNSNLLAFAGMLGLVAFAVEYAIVGTRRWISAISFLASALCVYLAKSAGISFALVAIGVAAVVSILVEGKERDIRHRYYRFAWGAAAFGGVFVLLFRAQVFEFFGKSPDMTGRSGIWKIVLKMIGEHPWTGWGWISNWVPGVKPFEGLVVIDRVPYYQAHNAYLDVWMQIGLIGLLLLMTVIVLTFVKAWRLAVRHTSALYLWPVLTFVGLLVWSATESRMLIEIGWVLLALFAVKVWEPEETLEPRGRSPKRVRLLGRGLLGSRLRQRKDR